MDPELIEAFARHGGILRTRDLLELGCYYRKLQKLIEEGEIEQLRRGYYQYMDDEKAFSEAAIIAALFPQGVVCMESALDIYGYTERVPSAWNIAMESTANRRQFNIKYPLVKGHFLNPSRFPIGITQEDVEGTMLRIYDRERTICDCLLHRNQMDGEVFNSAIQGYLEDPLRREAVLAEYAEKLHVMKKVREIVCIWL